MTNRRTTRTFRPWTDYEIAYALRHYGPMTARQIGQRLGRTKGAVKQFLHRQGNTA